MKYDPYITTKERLPNNSDSLSCLLSTKQTCPPMCYSKFRKLARLKDANLLRKRTVKRSCKIFDGLY